MLFLLFAAFVVFGQVTPDISFPWDALKLFVGALLFYLATKYRDKLPAFLQRLIPNLAPPTPSVEVTTIDPKKFVDDFWQQIEGQLKAEAEKALESVTQKFAERFVPKQP